MKAYEVVREWAEQNHVRFVSRTPGQCTTDTVSKAALEELVSAATEPLLERIAALDAKLAQRAPEGWKLVPVKPTEAMVVQGAGIIDDNGGNARWSDMREAWDTMLSAAPAAPEQQKECWCESCDLAQGNPMGRIRMSTCPQCGDKRCPRAKHHDAACQVAQAPNAQQSEPYGLPAGERAAELAADPVRGPRIAALRERLKKQAESLDPCSLCWVKGFHACAVAQALNAQQEPVAVIRTWHKQGEMDQHAELIDWFDALENSPDGEHMLFTRPQPAQLQAMTIRECAEATSRFAHVWSDDMLGIAEAIQSALAAKNGAVLAAAAMAPEEAE